MEDANAQSRQSVQGDIKEKVMELAKRRGFLWPSCEIYGGLAGMWDYGPLGAALKRKVEDVWRDIFVFGEGFHEIETPTISTEDVFIASGHVSSFVDLIVECLQCKAFYRADHIVTEHLSKLGISTDICEPEIEEVCVPSKLKIEKLIKTNHICCPECGGDLGEVHDFNLMFKTQIGPGTQRRGYLRPETAQGIFIDFSRLLRFYRDKLPFGVAQVGKSYRNEISPRQGIIRLREFTQAEVEVFVNPHMKAHHPRFDEVSNIEISILTKNFAGLKTIANGCNEGLIANEYLGYHLGKAYQFFTTVGIRPDKLRFRQHLPDEMAHYATDCWDAEALTQYGWIEMAGISDRTAYDLKQHEHRSGVEMKVFVPFDRPKIVDRTIIKPNMGYLGPKYKNKAKKIAEVLSSMSNPIQPIMIDGEVIDENAYVTEVISEEVMGEAVTPHVIEPSYGIDRTIYALLEHSYNEDVIGGDRRVVLQVPTRVSPIQVAIFPLVKSLREKAKDVHKLLCSHRFLIEYDESGTIGRRYRRHDEIGTPFTITVDHQTLEDHTVTVRERDSTKQIREVIGDLPETIERLLNSRDFFQKLFTM
jgi:glycyl-tRNA synthetase